ncbi:MAG TPA: tetraacyldisaccharide 4'-kinase [Desulfuromonadales bacterium]|nr:tetraacyldisaccharide 4'-kinase [Desulfuromonadales bacterium]
MNASWQTYWRKLASGTRREPVDRLLLFCLVPPAWLYSCILRLRALLYQAGIMKTAHLPRPVVSIGNITVGGTGKTPVTAFIARMLMVQGYKVAVISRGYGGVLEGQTCIVSDGDTIMMTARECGDEPYLLASTIPGLMVVIGTDRYAAGLMAMQQLTPDIFLLDDGFQHLRLHRDLNILLLDFSLPFGNGWTLPAGMLREATSAIRRSDLVIFTRTPEEAAIPIDTRGIPRCLARHTLTDLLPLHGGAPLSFSDCREKKVAACAGIADPEAFFTALRSQGLQLVQTFSYPDHVAYDTQRCAELAEALQANGADVLVTTEKDGVKLKGCTPEMAARTLLARLELTIDTPELLKGKLAELLQHS